MSVAFRHAERRDVMRRGFANWLLALALFFALALAAAQAFGQESKPLDDHPFDGEWTLIFTVSTPPGGVKLKPPYVATTQTHHVRGLSLRRSFGIDQEGKFAWEERTEGRFRNWGLSGNPTLYPYRSDHEMVLRVEGQAAVGPPMPKSDAPREQHLKLRLAWAYGSGSGITATPMQAPIDYRLSRDGNKMTATTFGSSSTSDAPYAAFDWELDGKPSKVEVNGRVRTTIYEKSRVFTQALPGGEMKLIEKVVVVHKHRIRADLEVTILPVDVPRDRNDSVSVQEGKTFEFDVRVINRGPDDCPDGRLDVIFGSAGGIGMLVRDKVSNQGRVVEASDRSLTLSGRLAAGEKIVRRIQLQDFRPIGPYDRPYMDSLLRDAFTRAFEDARKQSQRDNRRRSLPAGAIEAFVISSRDDNESNNTDIIGLHIYPATTGR
jgi:hypothetical protein